MNEYNNNIHVMGFFGLLYSFFIIKRLKKDIIVSAGVYQQHEYTFTINKYYFTRQLLLLFKKLKNKSIIFFNESNVKSYS